MVRLAVIVAAAENGIIGADNDLPWHLPEDLRYFKRVTMGKPIIMGRKTYESIGRPLPGRTNIVISRRPGFAAEGVIVVQDIEEALARAEVVAAAQGAEEVMVIGGAQIYQRTLGRAQRLYLTRIHASVSGDVCLPDIAWDQWLESGRERHLASGDNPYDYSFIVYDRIAG